MLGGFEMSEKKMVVCVDVYGLCLQSDLASKRQIFSEIEQKKFLLFVWFCLF